MEIAKPWISILCEGIDVEQSYIGLIGSASALFEAISRLVSAPGAYRALVFLGLLGLGLCGT